MALTNAQILLGVVKATLESDIRTVQRHSRQYALASELVFRVLLTFLPEGTDPSVYIPLLQDAAAGFPTAQDSDVLAEPTGAGKDEDHVSPEEARKRVKQIRLLPLRADDQIAQGERDDLPRPLVVFLLLRSRRIDSETGSLPMVQQLLEPFIDRNVFLKFWMATTILPLLRLNYEIYADRDEPITLVQFEELRGGAALDTLIGGGTGVVLSAVDYVRDLRQIVGPWLQGEIYRRRWRQKMSDVDGSGDDGGSSGSSQIDGHISTSTWEWVSNWLLHLAEREPQIALAIVQGENWHGPGDIDDGGWIVDDATINDWIWDSPVAQESAAFQKAQHNYARARMCLFYTVPGATEELFGTLSQLLLQISADAGHGTAVDDVLQQDGLESVLAESFLEKIKPFAHRMRSLDLLSEQNPLTDLTLDSMVLAAWYLKTSIKLLNLDVPLPVSKVVEMAILGTPSEQRGLLQRYLQIVGDKKVDDSACVQVRDNAHLLRSKPTSGSPENGTSYGVWGQLDSEESELLFLRALLAAGRYKLSSDMLNSAQQTIRKEVLEDTVLSVALAAFDGATNGNRTRGGMKKASDLASAMSPHFPQSFKFVRFEALLRATHALSSYSLKLQHGVLCGPAHIRNQSQPLSLIDKVLEQNKDAYTSLDDLIRIATDLVRSGLLVTYAGQLMGSSTLHPTLSMPSFLPDFLVMDVLDVHDTIEAATQAVTSKAVRASLDAGDFETAYSYITTRLAGRTAASLGDPNEDNDTLWRTALTAGRFESQNQVLRGPKQLRRLEQKMELLASALELAPSYALADVLEAWQECEGQVNAAAVKESEAETAWDDSAHSKTPLRAVAGDRHVPGGFGPEAYIMNAEGTGGRKWTSGEEEAPMGLFDVARGAAAALQRSAFTVPGTGPGRGAGSLGPGSAGTQQRDSEDHEEHGRLRKRDMVSKAATSALVSGIGWVIGKWQAADTVRLAQTAILSSWFPS